MLSLLSASVLAVASCTRPGDEQMQVGQSFDRYMAAWERNDRKAAWNFMSDRMRKANGNNEAEIENDKETPDVRILGHTTKRITASGERATVEANVKFSADWGKVRGTESERFQFVRENGRWVLDDEKPINAG